MFKFIIDDRKKYKRGDEAECTVIDYIDEPANVLVQHLALIYAKVLHITMQFDIDEKEVNALAFEYLEEYYPEDVNKLIKDRMRKGEYQYDYTKMG